MQVTHSLPALAATVKQIAEKISHSRFLRYPQPRLSRRLYHVALELKVRSQLSHGSGDSYPKILEKRTLLLRALLSLLIPLDSALRYSAPVEPPFF